MGTKTRLGRGLDALISGDEEATPTGSLAEVALEAIEENPYQPRKDFDEGELNSLSASIKAHGVLQPVVVRQVGDRYQLIAGERRLRAARSAGLATIPVRIVDFNDQQTVEAALVENIQRTDLNPLEKAQGFRDYLDRFSMTHEQLASRLGLARPTISNLVALLELPEEIQGLIRAGQITLGHAKILKGIPDVERMKALAREIIARGLSVHATEALVKGAPTETSEPERTESSSRSGSAPEKTAHVVGLENELRQKLGVKFEIKLKAEDKGAIVLTFDSGEDFERLIEVLRR
jgi:ParB family chromosome partitioning protein